MSLKAKLEAVIYAAEEPVTLGQLSALFAADAMEWKAEREAAAAEQTAEMAGESPAAPESLPLLDAGLQYLGLSDAPAVYVGPSPEPNGSAAAPAPEAAPEAVPEAAEPAGTEAAVTGTEPAGEAQPAEPVSEAAPASETVVSVGETEAYPPIEVREESPEAKPAEEAPVDPESEARRLSRQRDREVKGILKQLLDELIAECSNDGRGVEIREIAGGYRMATKPECHDAVRLFVKSLKPPLKLSLPALETLAVVAYKQPVTAPEVSEIRGVESAGVLGSLLSRKLIATAGRKQVIGRPILYKTTKEFLLRFGLKDVSELPSMEEFEKMAASELEIEPEGSGPEQAAEGESEPEENAQENLESNSPSGEELAAASEAVEVTEQSAAPAVKPAEPVPPQPAEPEMAAVESKGTEANPHAEENEKQG